MKIRNILTGLIGGLLLSLPIIYVSYFPYLEFQKVEIHFIISIFISCLIVAFALLYKNNLFKYALARMTVMVICCYAFIRFLAITGVLEKISNFLLIQENEANSRVSGLGIFFLLIPILFESIVIGIVLLLREKFWKKSSDC